MKNDIRILIVDDEEMMLSLLTEILSTEHYQTATANSGDAALELLAEEKFEIVISDLKMPGMNGFELLKEVKEIYPDLGFIIMTAHGEKYTIKDALVLGADEYIRKPFQITEMLSIVERAYWRQQSNRANQSATI